MIRIIKMNEFVRGNIVKLKSDGPEMTVRGIEGEYVICDWFDGDKPMEKSFINSTLEHIKSTHSGVQNGLGENGGFQTKVGNISLS